MPSTHACAVIWNIVRLVAKAALSGAQVLTNCKVVLAALCQYGTGLGCEKRFTAHRRTIVFDDGQTFFGTRARNSSLRSTITIPRTYVQWSPTHATNFTAHRFGTTNCEKHI